MVSCSDSTNLGCPFAPACGEGAPTPPAEARSFLAVAVGDHDAVVYAGEVAEREVQFPDSSPRPIENSATFILFYAASLEDLKIDPGWHCDDASSCAGVADGGRLAE